MPLVVRVWRRASTNCERDPDFAGDSEARDMLGTQGMREIEATQRRHRALLGSNSSQIVPACYHATGAAARSASFWLGPAYSGPTKLIAEPRLNDGDDPIIAGAAALDWLDGLRKQHPEASEIWGWAQELAIRSLLGHVLGIALPDPSRLRLEPGHSVVFQHGRDTGWQIASINL